MPNPNDTYIPLNSDAGPLIDIVLTRMARYVEILEDTGPSAGNGGVAQGVLGNKIDPVTGALQPPVAGDGYWKQVDPEGTPALLFPLGDPRSVHGGMGVPVGGTGAVVAQLKSATGTVTQVILREWY